MAWSGGFCRRQFARCVIIRIPAATSLPSRPAATAGPARLARGRGARFCAASLSVSGFSSSRGESPALVPVLCIGNSGALRAACSRFSQAPASILGSCPKLGRTRSRWWASARRRVASVRSRSCSRAAAAARPGAGGRSSIWIREHESRLTELLQPHTSMTVVDAAHGVQGRARSRLRHPAQYERGDRRRRARRSRRGPTTGARTIPSITSCARWRRCRDRTRSASILSGTGSDGTLGVCEIKAAGGVTFAQDEQSAQHAGHAAERDRQRGRRSGAAARGDRRAPRRRCSSIPISRRRTMPTPTERDEQRGGVPARDRGAARTARASISASIATRPSSGAPRAACCCAASRRPASTRSSSSATATKPRRCIATS